MSYKVKIQAVSAGNMSMQSRLAGRGPGGVSRATECYAVASTRL